MHAQSLLKSLFDAGITMEQVTEELIWIAHKKIDLCSIKGSVDYLTISRAGRNFGLNRRQKIALVEYVNRVADIIVTNVEVHQERMASQNDVTRTAMLDIVNRKIA